MSEFPTLSEITQDVVRIRKDGSFVTTRNGHYYYVPAPGKMGKLYMELTEWAKTHETMPEEEYEAQKEQARIAAFYENLSNAKEAIANQINSYVSEKIYAGFDYEIGGKNLHFSYEAVDQQNFADTANAVILSQSAGASLPSSVTWNGYDSNGELVQLELDAQGFIALYSQGALAHKAACMAESGAMKAAVRDVADGDALKTVVEGFPFSVSV